MQQMLSDGCKLLHTVAFPVHWFILAELTKKAGMRMRKILTRQYSGILVRRLQVISMHLSTSLLLHVSVGMSAARFIILERRRSGQCKVHGRACSNIPEWDERHQ